MKKLILICGPNGVGKTTLCKALHNNLLNSALVEPELCTMINPFRLNDDIGSLTISNITHLLRNYLNCSSVDYVIFNYGLHGLRSMIFKKVMENLKDTKFEFVPFSIKCDENENIKRMIKDERDEERIQRALSYRSIYEQLEYPVIDTTSLTVEKTVERVLQQLNATN